MSDPESKLDKTESNEDLKNQLPRSRKKGFRIVAVLLLLGLVGVSIWYFILRHPPIPSNLIEVSEGSSVKAGQVIAVLDDAQLVAREEQAQAIVDQSETRITRARQQIAILEEQLRQSQIGVDQAKLDSQGRVNQAEAQISQANSQIAQAEAQLAQAEVNLKQAKYDEEKSLRLYKTGDVPPAQA